MIDGVIINRLNKTKKIKKVVFQVSNQSNQGTYIMTFLKQVDQDYEIKKVAKVA